MIKSSYTRLLCILGLIFLSHAASSAVYEVKEGGSIQAAVTKAQSGDVSVFSPAPITKPFTSTKTISR